ncbi:MAG: hypothetical protein HYY26_05910 [Acidobacteria bacterium]|nr:hypothetical protein [Acidobacteriota bacterium]
MSRRAQLAIAAVFLLIVGFAVYSTLGLGQVTVEVCMEFKGRSECRTAAAPTEEEAIRTATDNACGLLAAGRDESMACSATPPTSVRRLP